MKNIFFSIILLTLFARCGNKTAPETAQTNAETPAASETIRLSRGQLEKSGIALGQPELRSIATTLTANGMVVVLPQSKATVTSKIGGRIEQFFIHEGQQVKKGQVLMSIASNAIFDLQQAYLQAKADLMFWEKELERQKTLSSQNVGATKNYEEARSKYAHTQGDVQVAAAKLRYLGIDLGNLDNPDRLNLAQTVVITAPISGNVSSVLVNLGASVGEGTTVCNIVGLDDLHAHVEVFAKDIGRVQPGQMTFIRFPNTALPQLRAEVEYISRELNPDTKTFSLHVHLPASKGNSYLPGMPIIAEIQTRAGARTMALPEAAVLHDGRASYCFIALNPDKETIDFQKIVFEPTLQNGGWIGIPEGLLTGKTVVLRGANLIEGQMRRGEMEE
jgi:membrane fusion protein, heavy metal efflux system